MDLKCEERLLTRWRPTTRILIIIERNSRKKFQRNYLENQKHFLELVLHFLNLYKILGIFKKNITFITLIFSELLIPKNVVAWIPESCSLRTPFGGKQVKGSQTPPKTARQHFYANFSFMSNNVRCVSCFLVGSEMWGPSFNRLTADHTYSCHSREKFLQQLPTQLSSKPKRFSGSFNAFFKTT